MTGAKGAHAGGKEFEVLSRRLFEQNINYRFEFGDLRRHIVFLGIGEGKGAEVVVSKF